MSGNKASKKKRGRPRVFSDLAITTVLMVKRLFSMPIRASQGFIDSVFPLAQLPLCCPHYSCISRRAKDVEVSFKMKTKEPTLHLAVDTSTHEIIAAELSLAAVTDGEVLPNLLKKTRRKILEISGNGAYDTKDCQAAIRIKRAVALIRDGEAFWVRGNPRNLRVK